MQTGRIYSFPFRLEFCYFSWFSHSFSKTLLYPCSGVNTSVEMSPLTKGAVVCHFPQKGNYDCSFFGTWTAVGCSVTFVQDGRGPSKVPILPNSANPPEMFSNIWNLTRSQAHLALVFLNCWAQTENAIHLLQSRFPKTHPNFPWWELFDVFVFVGLTPSFSRFTSWS